MKIVCCSDIHGQISYKLTKWFMNHSGDLFLFAGDLQTNNLDYGAEFINWVDKLPFKHKVLIFGNHDGNYDFIRFFIHRNPKANMHFLINETVEIEGIKIFGSPYSVTIPNHHWWFSETDDILKGVWENIPVDTDILLTHCPPYGILDDTTDGFTVGSKTLLNRISELKNLKYHVFGHIHESYGAMPVGRTKFINASLLNEYYNLINDPFIINYNDEQE